MRISVFGLGYVGCVSAACLAHDGHHVIGVNINPQKVQMLQMGRSPIIEPGLDALVEEGISSERLCVTTDGVTAVTNSDVSLICVGTPSNGNGSLKVDYVENVCRQIGAVLADKPSDHVVIIRSTVLPGTVQGTMLPILEEASGKKAGVDFGLCMNPEFLRESTAIDDYYKPSYIVIGELNTASGDAVESMYEHVDAPFIRTSIQTAEMVKYASNAYHALKISFANEIGNLCRAQGIDGREMMEIFVQDTQLNVSSAYLKPGFAFGGSCLPKDIRALLYRAKERDLSLPVLSAVLDSNERQIQRGIEMVERTGMKKIGVMGLSFKAGTDDVRESPIVTLIETLIGRGYQVQVYDETVRPERLIGANKAFLERELPHIASIMRSSIDEVLQEVEVVVIANASRTLRDLPRSLRAHQRLIDLAGSFRESRHSQNGYEYEGICW